MSNNFGTWSPLTSILPNVEDDLDYKFFYVTESGSVPGLDIEFKVGDWLVYIKENNQKEKEEKNLKIKDIKVETPISNNNAEEKEKVISIIKTKLII